MRPCAPDQPDMTPPLRGLGGIATSLMLHGLLLGVLASLAPKLMPPLEPEEPIEVDFVLPPPKPAPPASLRAQDGVAASPAAQEPPTPAPATNRTDDGMVRSSKIYSGAVLAREGNEEALHDYRNLAPDEQREQLCSLETLEQIAAWSDAYQPERMVTYSFGDVLYEGRHMIANGAVFWSHDNWHRVKFDCEFSEDMASVVSLSFAVGTIVPKSDWEAHYLNKYK